MGRRDPAHGLPLPTPGALHNEGPGGPEGRWSTLHHSGTFPPMPGFRTGHFSCLEILPRGPQTALASTEIFAHLPQPYSEP